MPILSQHQVRDIALLILEKLNLRIKRGRKKLGLPISRALQNCSDRAYTKITAAEN
jgi:hypothetical protein